MTTDFIFGYREDGIASAALCITDAPWEYPTREKVWFGQRVDWDVRRVRMEEMPSRAPVRRAEEAGYCEG